MQIKKNLYKKFCNWKDLDFSVDVNEDDFNLFFPLIIGEDDVKLNIYSAIEGVSEILNIIREYIDRYKIKNKYKKIIIKI
jgi:hypothetical protein